MADTPRILPGAEDSQASRSTSTSISAADTSTQAAPTISVLLVSAEEPSRTGMSGTVSENGMQGEDRGRAGPSNAGGVVESEEERPEAEPLPVKRGELGFQERYARQLAAADDDDEQRDMPTLPERHPADRDPPNSNQAPQTDGASSISEDSQDARAAAAAAKSFGAKAIPALGGIHMATFLYLVFQVVLICGTIGGWVAFGLRMSSANSSSDSNNNAANPFGGNTYQIFAHVLFTVALIMQFIFLERRIYRVRVERYCFANPGLPLFAHGRRGREPMPLGFAPWNRPPLPTYAAVLAQSGVGTGDVEDSAIAIAPPPAYGHTRGSTLLLAGAVTDTLRAQRRRERGSCAESSVRTSVASSRPVSYVSRDEEWEERRNALRTVKLEETLARLEDARISSRDGELRR